MSPLAGRASLIGSVLYKMLVENSVIDWLMQRHVAEARAHCQPADSPNPLPKLETTRRGLWAATICPDLNKTTEYVWTAQRFLEDYLDKSRDVWYSPLPSKHFVAVSNYLGYVISKSGSRGEEVSTVRGKVVDLGDTNARVVYLEGESTKEYVLPRSILRDDGVDELGAEFHFDCWKDSKGEWTGRFRRIAASETQPDASDISDEECRVEFLRELPPEPLEDLLASE
jgi:hypothetical protein